MLLGVWFLHSLCGGQLRRKGACLSVTCSALFGGRFVVIGVMVKGEQAARRYEYRSQAFDAYRKSFERRAGLCFLTNPQMSSGLTGMTLL